MKTIDAKMAWTGEEVTIQANVPYGRAARKSDTMTGLAPDTLVYSPKIGLVETAKSAVKDSLGTMNDMETMLTDGGANPDHLEAALAAFEDADPEALAPLLTRRGWEAIFDDANIAVAELAG